jgi:hypothetical protein
VGQHRDQQPAQVADVLPDGKSDVDVMIGRLIRADGLSASARGHAGRRMSCPRCRPDIRIWWVAYLGMDGKLVVAGTIGDVGDAARHIAG